MGTAKQGREQVQVVAPQLRANREPSAAGKVQPKWFQALRGCREMQALDTGKTEGGTSDLERGKRKSDFPERERTQGMGGTSTPFALPG